MFYANLHYRLVIAIVKYYRACDLKTEMMNNTKLVPLPLNGAYASELLRPTINHKFTRAQVKLTRAWILVGPDVF